jgi:hypothetical protein
MNTDRYKRERNVLFRQSTEGKKKEKIETHNSLHTFSSLALLLLSPRLFPRMALFELLLLLLLLPDAAVCFSVGNNKPEEGRLFAFISNVDAISRSSLETSSLVTVLCVVRNSSTKKVINPECLL